MKWTVQQLRRFQHKEMAIDETVDVSDLKQIDTLIRDISPVRVQGKADVGSTKFTFHLTLSGTMVLPCSRTLVDVAYPFSIETTETFFADGGDFVETDEDTHVVTGETIDLNPIIRELILLEIPLQLIADNPAADGAPQHGEGWDVLSEEQWEKAMEQRAASKVDPRLAGLAKFFEEKNEE
ncbi:hypothetical protein GS3922_10960 [Geobacillus subterraneus]|uniref:DUF177 domain-containing protein n=2 Tax=Geobacillus TaxID=129337 RepID=A0ABM6ACV9_9BACL|nr:MULTISPECIES: YceD family protein [Geobacillus]AMX84138.1 hypothetical protein GS3922_10960 [Geobacillus subterraneus]KZS26950.1 hypothetical protein A5418_02060 [Geobacillus subterraneus]OXB88344.1 hypothetical protein B9L21_10850 [Geobacillus uzenensis]QIZ67228.1 DUF177 domain-containing protein [Geobacillus subterraneus]WPZ19411.1 YceD family protein [Geobacillus subterraneus]